MERAYISISNIQENSKRNAFRKQLQILAGELLGRERISSDYSVCYLLIYIPNKSNQELVEQANKLSLNIVHGVLNDPKIRSEVTRLLSDVVQSGQVTGIARPNLKTLDKELTNRLKDLSIVR